MIDIIELAQDRPYERIYDLTEEEIFAERRYPSVSETVSDNKKWRKHQNGGKTVPGKNQAHSGLCN